MLTIVGVKSKRIKELCYKFDNIRPLHLAQSLAANIQNYKLTQDKDWKWDLKEERIDIYNEAKRDYNLSIMQLNDLAWEEFEYYMWWGRLKLSDTINEDDELILDDEFMDDFEEWMGEEE